MKKKRLSTYSIEFDYNLGFFLEEKKIGKQKVAINFAKKTLEQELVFRKKGGGYQSLSYEYSLTKELVTEILQLIDQLKTDKWAERIKKHYPKQGTYYWQMKIRYRYQDRRERGSADAPPELLHQVQKLLNDRLEPNYPIMISETIVPSSEVVEKALAERAAQMKKNSREWKKKNKKVNDYKERIKERLSYPVEESRGDWPSTYDNIVGDLLHFQYCAGLEERKWHKYDHLEMGNYLIPGRTYEGEFLTYGQAVEANNHFIDLLEEDRRLTKRQASKMKQTVLQGLLLHFSFKLDQTKDFEKVVTDCSEVMMAYQNSLSHGEEGAEEVIAQNVSIEAN